MPKQFSTEGIDQMKSERSPLLVEVRNLLRRIAKLEGIIMAPKQYGGVNPSGNAMRLYSDYVLSSSGNTVTCAPSESKMVSVYAEGIGWINKTIEASFTFDATGSTSNKLYDLFISWGVDDLPVIASVAWSSETARATSLDTVDGVRLLSTDYAQRYLTTARYNGSTMLLPKQDANGELFYGTGDPRNNTLDPFSGVGMSAGGVTFGAYTWQFFAALAGVVGVGFNALGQLLAGAGAVVLDALGISITTSSAYSAPLSIKWYDNAANLITQIFGVSATGSNTEARFQAKRISGRDTGLYVEADFPTGRQGAIYVELDKDGGLVSKLDMTETFVRLYNATSILLTGPTTLSSRLNESQGTDIASATTTDIGASTGNYVKVTGTTTITGLGTVQAGTRRIVEFTGALTLTNNATSLILPGGANITTAAGDTAIFVSLGSGNWKCVLYYRASSVPSTGTNTGDQTIRSALFGSGMNNTVGASSTAYIGPGYSGAPQANEADVAISCPIFTGVTLRDFYIRTRSAQPASGSLVATYRAAAVDTAIVITISAGAAAGNYSDTTHTGSAVVGQALAAKLVNNATAASAQIGGHSIEIDAA